MQEMTIYEYPNVKVCVSDLTGEGIPSRERERVSEKKMLKQILGEDVSITHNEAGKPGIEGSDWNISVSHSRHKLCIALSKEDETGVDIEELHPRLEKVKHMFLKEEELKLLPEDSLQALALCWSAKEAVYKLAGEKAGAMGEKVVIDIDEVAKIVASEDKKREFHARVDKEEFLLKVVDMNAEYEIVLACRYTNKY